MESITSYKTQQWNGNFEVVKTVNGTPCKIIKGYVSGSKKFIHTLTLDDAQTLTNKLNKITKDAEWKRQYLATFNDTPRRKRTKIESINAIRSNSKLLIEIFGCQQTAPENKRKEAKQ